MNLEELSEIVVGNEQRSKSNTHRIDKLEQRQDSFDKLVASVAVLAEKQDRMESDLGEIKSDIKSIAAKPGKHWDSAIDKIVLTLIGAVMAYILAKVGF